MGASPTLTCVAVTGRFSFRPAARLHNAADYTRVYRGGARAGDAIFGISALPNATGQARLGMSISKKTVGNSVQRNRVRRLIREFFRHRAAELPPLDFVVTSRPGARSAARPDLLASLDRLTKVAVRKASTDTPRSEPNAPRGPAA